MNGAQPVRRITGSSDLRLTPEGHKQAEKMAAKYSEPFDHVFCGPEIRDIETAKEFGKPKILRGLNAWARGAFEAQDARLLTAAMKNLILNPDSKPPGRSPISKFPGESFNAFMKPLMHVARTIKESWKPAERLLCVTSGGNIEAVNEMAPKNFPDKLTKDDLRQLAEDPYASVVGELFLETEKGLQKVQDNKDPGRYWMGHQQTIFNPKASS